MVSNQVMLINEEHHAIIPRVVGYRICAVGLWKFCYTERLRFPLEPGDLCGGLWKVKDLY